jgi:hypothetical protein
MHTSRQRLMRRAQRSCWATTSANSGSAGAWRRRALALGARPADRYGMSFSSGRTSVSSLAVSGWRGDLGRRLTRLADGSDAPGPEHSEAALDGAASGGRLTGLSTKEKRAPGRLAVRLDGSGERLTGPEALARFSSGQVPYRR